MSKKDKIPLYVKFFSGFAVIYLCANLISGCNRNSDQLPTITGDTLTVTIPYVINNFNLNFIFKQIKSGVHDTEWVMIQNNNDEDFTGISALVQMCNTLPQNLTNCTLQKSFSIDTLKKNSTSALYFLYSDQQLILAKNYINEGIISCDNLHHPLAGIYYSNNTFFKNSVNDSGIAYGSSRGYVFADGKSVFMFAGPDTSYSFSFTGSFDSNQAFNGDMVYNEKVVSTVGIDTFSIPGNLPAVVKWKIATKNADSVDFISDVLIKSK